MPTAVVKSYFKDPVAVKDYGFTWTDFLNGDVIETSEWNYAPVEGSGTLALSLDSHDTEHTVVWVGGGEIGERFTLTNHIVTAAGREEDKSLLIVIRDE